jgi:non-specific serine/threonine protein kinase
MHHDRLSTLPVPSTQLIGRERELAFVCQMLLRPDVRLVTLTGPGGAGKTRLGIAIAEQAGDAFADGVLFVPLATLGDPDLVALTIAHAAGLHEAGSRSALEILIGALRERAVLLVADNFERLLPAASVLSGLLAACPQMKALVTSRAALRLHGENEFAVPSLAVPDPTVAAQLEQLAGYEAVRLFIARAQAINPDFVVTNETALPIAEICARVDGLPLAIELAAARVRILTPPALLARLRHPLGLLTGGPRDAPARQQTLRATIAWSHDLLSGSERMLVRRLSAFVGGCTLASAEAICNPDGEFGVDVLDGLESLVLQSLVRHVGASDGEPRYGMLETIREFFVEQLEASGEAEVVRRRYALHYLGLAEQAKSELWGTGSGATLEYLEQEHANLRAVLAWCIEDARDAELGLRLSAALGRFWMLRSHLKEGRRWLARALAASEGVASSARLDALSSAVTLADFVGAIEEQEALAQRALALSRELGDHWFEARAMMNLGRVWEHRGDVEQVERRVTEALALSRKLGDPWLTALCLEMLGETARVRGDYDQAVPLYEESIALARDVGDGWLLGAPLYGLAMVASYRGDVRAAALLEESLRLSRENGDRRRIAKCLDGFAGLAVETGQATRAARLVGAASALRESTGAVVDPMDRADHAHIVAKTRRALGDTAFDRALAEGSVMDQQRAVVEALLGNTPKARAGMVSAALAVGPAVDPLTRREQQVAALIAHGLTNRQIAEQLIISERTADNHVANILGKLGFSARAQVAVWAAEQGLLAQPIAPNRS